MLREIGICRIVLGLTIAALVSVGCARPPEREMKAADEAVEAAIAAEAEKYAPDELKEAKDALEETRKKSEEKEYAEAKKLAIKAKEKADEAKAAAEAEKAGAEKDAGRLLDEAKATVQGIKALIDSALAAKVPEVPQFKESCASLDSSVVRIEGCIEEKDYLGAIEGAKAVKTEAESLQVAVKAALQKR